MTDLFDILMANSGLKGDTGPPRGSSPQRDRVRYALFVACVQGHLPRLQNPPTAGQYHMQDVRLKKETKRQGHEFALLGAYQRYKFLSNQV